ncbi:unnamed protein product [Adineta ricciae]|uniref:Uncharacterized protein n=1 Tax=Adineta ricciae TaxID=249248 RepID=A0A813VVT0_ADIRI|nr:unnamed protein product [Adineta ricciae]
MVYTIIVHLVAKPEHVDKVKAKLIEASRVYKNDKETIDWHVAQGLCLILDQLCLLTILLSDVHDPCKFSIVERYEQESSQSYHLNNPYWKTFDPYK